MKDKLEKAFQDALENHELPYNANAWNAVQKQLPTNKTPWYKIGGAAAVILSAVILFAVFQNSDAEKTAVSKKVDHVEQNNESVSNPPEQALADVASEMQNNPIPERNNTSEIQTKNRPAQVARTESATSVDPNSTAKDTSLNSPKTVVSDNSTNNAESEQWLKEIQNVEIQGLARVYCENNSVNLRVVNLPKNTVVLWALSDGTELHGESAQFKAKHELSFSLIFKNISKHAPQKMNAISVIRDKKIHVAQAAQADVVVTKDERNTKTYVTLANTNPDIEHLVWRMNQSTTQEQTLSTYLTTKGVHHYTVDTYDKNGCFATVKGDVQIEKDYNLFVENTFTPNGDGINDHFLPEALKLRSVNFKLTIFDKNGKLIYATSDQFAPWDGSINGQPADSDTYIWTVSLINEEGMPEQYKGTILLKR